MSTDKGYKQPDVHLGQSVLFFHGPGSPPIPAVVTSLSTRNVSLAVFHDGFVNLDHQSGVLHVTDPHADKAVEHDIGLWDYTTWDKKVLEAFESLGLAGNAEPILAGIEVPKRSPGRPRKEPAGAT